MVQLVLEQLVGLELLVVPVALELLVVQESLVLLELVLVPT